MPTAATKAAADAPLTLKSASVLLAIAVSATGLLMWIGGEVLVPKSVTAARELIQDAIDRHAMHPHVGAIGRDEWAMVIQRLDKTATAESLRRVDDAMQNLDKRLDAIDRRLLALEK